MDWGSEGHFGTFLPGMAEFIAILQPFRPGGLERVARRRRDGGLRCVGKASSLCPLPKKQSEDASPTTPVVGPFLTQRHHHYM